MMSSMVAASTKWRSKSKSRLFSGPDVSVSDSGVVQSSASSLATTTTQTLPMTVKEMTSMPVGSAASITSGTSVTSPRPGFPVASATWRDKWPDAPDSAQTTVANQPTLAPAPTPAKEAAAAPTASVGPTANEVVTAEPIRPEQPAAELIESHETGAVAPTTKPGPEFTEEAAASALIVAPPVEQLATLASQEVDGTAEQVEAAKPAEFEQPELAASGECDAAEPAPEHKPVAEPVALAAPTSAQNSAEGPEPAKPPVTAVEVQQPLDIAKPVMQTSAVADAPATTSKVEDGVTLTLGDAGIVDGNAGGFKVALLNFDSVGVPLADKFEIDRVFKWRKLQPLWVENAEHFPRDAQVLITTGTPVGSELLAKAPELKLVAVASEGYDHVDIDACKTRGVAVVNVPRYSTDAAAELALGFVLAHLRNLATCQKTVDKGFWTSPPQDKLSSKTVGIVGVGSLGFRLAELFKVFGVKALLGYSPIQTAAFMELGGTYLASLEELFKSSDVVCICCSFSPETKGLVSESLLELLSPSSVLVNVAHGGVIDEDALSRLLAQGRFRAGLDVFGKEPLPVNSSLRSVPAGTLLATPHVGYQTTECLERRFDVTTKNIITWLLDQSMSINRVA